MTRYPLPFLLSCVLLFLYCQTSTRVVTPVTIDVEGTTWIYQTQNTTGYSNNYCADSVYQTISYQKRTWTFTDSLFVFKYYSTLTTTCRECEGVDTIKSADGTLVIVPHPKGQCPPGFIDDLVDTAFYSMRNDTLIVRYRKTSLTNDTVVCLLSGTGDTLFVYMLGMEMPFVRVKSAL
jgi:hypothetical protein